VTYRCTISSTARHIVESPQVDAALVDEAREHSATVAAMERERIGSQREAPQAIERAEKIDLPEFPNQIAA
jgi:hypothetical protein